MYAQKILLIFLSIICALFTGCEGGQSKTSGSTSNGQQSSTQPNVAYFEYVCDLGGADGILTMTVEAIGGSGFVFGTGANPDLTGIIATGDVTYLISGDVRSDVAYYVFTGRNQFADFTDMNRNERFRVQWLPQPDDTLIMLVNPFEEGPVTYECVPQYSD